MNVATDRLRELGYVEAVCGSFPTISAPVRLHESVGWSDHDLMRDDEAFGVVVSEMRYRRLLVERSGQPDTTSD